MHGAPLTRISNLGKRLMTRILCLSVFVLAVCLSSSVRADDAAKQDSRSCGADYPAGFPCIAGGKPAKGIDGLPNLKTMNVVHYETSPKAIAERLEAEATSSGWTLGEREVGMEPGGPRYRISFTKEGVTVHASAFQSVGQTVLMIVTLTEKK